MDTTRCSASKRLVVSAIFCAGLFATGLAVADPEAYLMVHPGNDYSGPSEISSIDLATGAVGPAVDLTLDGHAVTTYNFGLLPGTSTYYTAIADSFYKINMATGQLTLGGTTGVKGAMSEAFASTATGFFESTAAFKSGGSSVIFSLYSVDIGTAEASLIGPITGVVQTIASGSSDSAPNLYLLNDEGMYNTSHLYVINTATALPTLIGDTHVFNLTSMIDVGGVYYGIGGIPGNAIYKIDPVTAATSLVTSLPNFPGEFGFLAPVVAVPELSARSALLAGLAALGGFVWLGNRRRATT